MCGTNVGVLVLVNPCGLVEISVRTSGISRRGGVQDILESFGMDYAYIIMSSKYVMKYIILFIEMYFLRNSREFHDEINARG